MTGHVEARFPRTPTLHANGNSLIHTLLTWHPDDAHAVRLTCRNTDGQAVTWWFDRQMLTDGLTAHVGEGDIGIGPVLAEDPDTGDVIEDPHHIEILLRDPAGIGGNLSLIYQKRALHTFLNRTWQQVAAGAEQYPFNPATLFEKGTA
ncbi:MULTISPECIES: SsgA family sporulation/cell division regulator [Pseudonocardia]|uniref:Sporulation and cell division protein n=2 Tax=Pseudonocardia TaxID=1847 RepID=A0A1Y2MLD5_PSEAH|nr:MULTISPECIES: SsgA family sporulation/cell division regulator [Pseudonocardia]OSY36084.1 hypothetical protein BG845_05599 [Pseudonocardia autotrophica]TDN77565.1 sporulation and cell division protein SsgA [Pseudonocardia autotrophica]BBG01594.1 hypothetical protein Pdca_28030 [Pseudonocardia autotrophica]GEC25339.1 hypothetical protein PSA01_23680 [Pseudonocardia saturnea]